MKEYKRKFRELQDSVKDSIRQSSKGKAKTSSHKEHISQGMKKYWSTVPSKPKPITMDDYFNITS